MVIESILVNQDLDMNELRTKTEKAIYSNPNLYSGIMKWISGNCWLNSKITNGYMDKLTILIKKYCIQLIKNY